MDKIDKEPPPIRFEDIEDMMDHSHEQINEAVYHFCLCIKVCLPDIDSKVVKALLLEFIEEEYDDLWPRLIPHVETKGDDTIVYGCILKD
jgi:hypothetical protein